MEKAAICWQTLLRKLSRSSGALCRGILGENVMTAGSGPCEENVFDQFLGKCKIEVHPVSEEISDGAPDVLVIGHRGWNKDELNEVIRTRSGRTLRVYSHEMVVASLAMGEDVFELLDEDELAAFGEGHPALEYLLEEYGFDWPKTEVHAHRRNRMKVDFSSMASPDTGLLSYVGYHVGKSGLDEKSRRRILDEVMSAELCPASERDTHYIDQWGKPSSADRLRKMANCLATFASNRKKTPEKNYSVAIAEWESDLEYLKSTYFKRGPRFDWPTTTVG